jgi:hypothetical protein
MKTGTILRETNDQSILLLGDNMRELSRSRYIGGWRVEFQPSSLEELDFPMERDFIYLHSCKMLSKCSGSSNFNPNPNYELQDDALL